jgi:hypothetical protein
VALLESYRNRFDERGEALAEVGASGPKQCGEARKLRFETALRGCTIRARVRLKGGWGRGSHRFNGRQTEDRSRNTSDILLCSSSSYILFTSLPYLTC